MGDIIIGLGFLGFLVSIVLLIIALIMKKQRKLWSLTLLGCLILMIVGVGILPESNRPEKKHSKSEKILRVRICPRDEINIRVGPGTNYDKDPRGPLKSGQKLYVVQDTGDWVRFRFTNKSSDWTGWVKKNLTVTEEDEERTTTRVEKVETERPFLEYRIVDKEDISYGATPRAVYRVILQTKSIPSQTQIRNTAVQIWKNGNQYWTEFTVFMYLPGMDTYLTAYAAADFTPYGLEELRIYGRY